MSASPGVRRRLLIEGFVQGVYFRQTTRQWAERFGLTGWVRNRRDGKVEVVAQGPPERVAELERWCSQGPAGARVRSVTAFDEPLEPLQSAFEIRPTD